MAGIVSTVGTYITFDGDGLGAVHGRQPKNKWEAVRGPVLIAAGVLVGLGGNNYAHNAGRPLGQVGVAFCPLSVAAGTMNR